MVRTDEKAATFCFASALDRNYVLPYSAMLISFRARNPGATASAFVLHYDLIDDDIAYLDRVAGRIGVPLTFVKIPTYPFEHFVVRKRLHLNAQMKMSPIAYAKAFLDRFLPATIDEVICIDADIVIAGEMSELLDLKRDCPIMAVANLPRNHHHQFNSGFMVVNLAQWRQMQVSDIAERFLYEYSDALFTHDQHTLNLIFKSKWQRIDLKWNYMEDFHRFSSKSRSYTAQEIEAARQDPIIIHFAVGTDKPWLRKSRHPKADMYRRYVGIGEEMISGLKLKQPGGE
jgi:lipopolysaccharide biosynthesis glycosyltransferase